MLDHTWSLIGLTIVVACAACSGPITPPPAAPRAKPKVEVQGHRGCRGLRPENTLAGFKEAARLGVDVLELDLAMSKDGVLLVVHDPQINIKLCAGGEGLASRLFKELTWAEVQRLDCGALKNPKYPDQKPVPGERIPRLEQVLDLLSKTGSLIANIEIKTFPDRREATRPPADFAAALVKVVRARGLQRRVVVQSFDAAALQAVRRLAPELTLAALADGRADFEPMLEASGAKIL